MKEYDAFISYSRVDEHLLKPVVQLLSISNRRIFWDTQTIQPGEKWSEAIEEALVSSATVVVLWCCHSAKSDWVKRETTLAAGSAIPLIPMLLCWTSLEAPLSNYQWIDLRAVIRHTCGHPMNSAVIAGVQLPLAPAMNLPSFDPEVVDAAWRPELFFVDEIDPVSMRIWSEIRRMSYPQKRLALTIEAAIRLALTLGSARGNAAAAGEA